MFNKMQGDKPEQKKLKGTWKNKMKAVSLFFFVVFLDNCEKASGIYYEGDNSIGSCLLSLLLTAATALLFSHSSPLFLPNCSLSLLLSSVVCTGLDLKK